MMTPASIAVILSLIQPACADFILTDIEKIVNHVIIMEKGRIVADQSIDAFIGHQTLEDAYCEAVSK